MNTGIHKHTNTETDTHTQSTWTWICPSSWLRIWSPNVPCTSKLLTPPSRFSVTLSFSSTVKVMGSVSGGAADLDWLAFGCTSSRMTSPSAFKDSKNWFVFWDLPSCMPKPFGGAVADEGGRPKDWGRHCQKYSN